MTKSQDQLSNWETAVLIAECNTQQLCVMFDRCADCGWLNNMLDTAQHSCKLVLSDENIEKAKGPNKFLKAAKTAAVISSLKFGRDICTCSSLDATCAVHDH